MESTRNRLSGEYMWQRSLAIAMATCFVGFVIIHCVPSISAAGVLLLAVASFYQGRFFGELFWEMLFD